MGEKEYQISLSFAGEDRAYVDKVASILRYSGVSLFYDKIEEVSLWGKDLYEYLTDVYKNKSLFTVMFISQYYREKLWTNHERRAMQARAFEESKEYILPARFDATEIPGVLPTTGYIDLTKRSPSELADLIIKKLIQSGQSVPPTGSRNPSHRIIKLPNIDNALESKVLIKNNEDAPIKGVTVTAICDNGTHKETITNEQGEAIFIFKVKRFYTLLISNFEYPAIVHDGWDMTDNVELILNKIDCVGSLICHSSCYIPNLKGRLNIIQDTSYRLYLYADNIVNCTHEIGQHCC